MCGISAIVSDGSTGFPFGFSKASLEGLQHRGPDGKGLLALKDGKVIIPKEEQLVEINPDLTLFHRRLSILDLSTAGHQPMSTNCANYHVIFNGEIYNYIELRRELVLKGYSFKSNSDTEVVINAYKEWKEKCVEKFVGMFALAIYDVKRNRIFLARDPFGIKPLYYCHWRGGIAFASEITPLLTLEGVGRVANSQRVFDYLRFGLTDHGSETLFRDIKQLQAANYLYINIKLCKVEKITKYWSVNIDNNLDLSFASATKKLRDLFLESVELHLRSDVVVGAALSGGIDSSAIVCAMRHLKPDLELHTLSFIAEDPKISEERWVDIISKHANTVTHKVRANQKELISNLDSLLLTQGEPFASTSIYAQNKIFGKASELGIKVMLDGQGADEILAGYSGFQGARFATLLKNGNIINAVKLLNNSSNWPGRTRSDIFYKGARALLPSYIHPIAMKYVGQKLDSDWLNIEWFLKQGVNLEPQRYGGCKKSCLKEELKNSVEEISLPHLLRYEDRNSMAYSIESRVPFLTTNIVDFLFSLPEEYLIDCQGRSKAVFREAMRGIVPDQILDRKDKIGFQTPQGAWLSQIKPWVESNIKSTSSVPVFNLKSLENSLEQIWQGRKSFDSEAWRWIDFLRWSKIYQIEFD